MLTRISISRKRDSENGNPKMGNGIRETGNRIWEMTPNGYALLYSVNRKKVFPLTLNPRLSV
jgi:hypothetical protein